MPGLDVFALGILLPALVCGVLLLFSQKLSEGPRGAVQGVAFGGSWLITFVVFVPGLPATPFGARTPAGYDWLAWTVVAVTIGSILGLASVPERIYAAVVRPVLAAELVFSSLGRWASRSGSWTALALSFLALVAVWSAGDSWIRRGSGLRAAVALWIAAVAVSLANLFAGSALLGALPGGAAACLGAAAALAVLNPGFRFQASASAVVALVLGGCVVQGLVFSRLPLASAFLLAASVVFPALADVRGRGARSRWKDALLAAALAAVPAAIAVGLAWSPSEDAY
jgi:hypothetical protein